MNRGLGWVEDNAPVDQLTTHLDDVVAAGRKVGVAQARQMTAVYNTVMAARRHPEVYVPTWSSQSRAKQVEYAQRSAVFDIVLRLSLSEGAVWGMYHDTEIVSHRMPTLWELFCSGSVVHQNVRTAATIARSLPEHDRRAFEELDAKLAERASVLTPSKFRTSARAIRERLHPANPVERHQKALQERRMVCDADHDGMGWISVYTDAATVMKTDARVTAAAARQRKVPGETRTLAQLKADAASDLLTGVRTAYEVKTHVQLDLPVTTLSDRPDILESAKLEPAILDGYGPIDEATAALMAADATAFRRVFTDPISGVVLNMDRKTYRPTAAQRELLRRKYRTCIAPTCACKPADSDIDHTTDWQFDGLTNSDNLAPLSRAHHTLKHETKITVTRNPDGTHTWRTPTGFTRDSDPPPF